MEFDIPDQRKNFGSEIGLPGQIGKPTLVSLQANLPGVKEVYLLLNLGSGSAAFDGNQTGKVTLEFEDQPPLDTPLIAGKNVREWCVSEPVVLDRTTDAATREVYRGETDPGASELGARSGCQVAIVDMLTITVPATHQNAVLTRLQLQDTSRETVGSPDPQLLLMGVSARTR